MTCKISVILFFFLNLVAICTCAPINRGLYSRDPDLFIQVTLCPSTHTHTHTHTFVPLGVLFMEARCHSKGVKWQRCPLELTVSRKLLTEREQDRH